MKKLSIYLGAIIALFVILFAVNQYSLQAELDRLAEPAERLYKTSPENLEPATRKQLTDENYQNIILREDLDERLANGESLLVSFFSPLCSFCVENTPIYNRIANEIGVEIHQLNVLEDPEASVTMVLTPHRRSFILKMVSKRSFRRRHCRRNTPGAGRQFLVASWKTRRMVFEKTGNRSARSELAVLLFSFISLRRIDLSFKFRVGDFDIERIKRKRPHRSDSVCLNSHGTRR